MNTKLVKFVVRHALKCLQSIGHTKNKAIKKMIAFLQVVLYYLSIWYLSKSGKKNLDLGLSVCR